MKKKSADKKTLRAFIAVPVPNSVVEYLRQLQKRLKASGIILRWTKPENSHVTLKFLGEIDQDRISPIASVLDEVTGRVASFVLQPKGVGVFPNFRRARVVWAGLAGNLSALSGLYADVDKLMARLGFDKEKNRFHPHFTLGRCKGKIDSRVLEDSLRSVEDFSSESYVVDRLFLIKSVLTPAGPRYTILHTSHLIGESYRKKSMAEEKFISNKTYNPSGGVA